MVDLNRGRGIVEALALAGGPLPTAALSKSYVIKPDGQKIPVDLSHLINQGPETATGRRGDGSDEAVQAYRATERTEGQGEGAARPIPSRAAEDLTLEAGDQLVVPENMSKIAVLGMVRQPHSFPMRDGQIMTLADAISLAGGFEKRAQKSKIGIIRMVNGKQTVVASVDMNRLVKGKDLNPVLQDRDIVYVPETRRPDWFGKILPGIQALTGAWWYVTRP
jgi:protein involved in polysaccharide export with SLBB domain